MASTKCVLQNRSVEMNELLLIVAGIFIICFLIGVNKGFIRIVASLFATLIILVLVIFATPYVTKALKDYTPIEESVQKKCSEMMKLDSVDTSIREAQIAVVEQSELPKVFKDLLLANNNTEVYESLGVDSFVDYVTAYFTKLIIDIIAFLATFIIVTLVVRIGLYILGIIGDLPLIGGINRVAGGAVGLVTGLIVVWIVFIAITVFYDMSVSKMFLGNIEENQFLQFLYNNNVLMNYLTKFRV